jgi:hypothetical protein
MDMDENTKDPKDDTYYTYFLGTNKKNFQFVAFMEQQQNQLASINSVAAQTREDRYPRTFGTSL